VRSTHLRTKIRRKRAERGLFRICAASFLDLGTRSALSELEVQLLKLLQNQDTKSHKQIYSKKVCQFLVYDVHPFLRGGGHEFRSQMIDKCCISDELLKISLNLATLRIYTKVASKEPCAARLGVNGSPPDWWYHRKMRTEIATVQWDRPTVLSKVEEVSKNPRLPSPKQILEKFPKHTVDASEIPNNHLRCKKPCKSWD